MASLYRRIASEMDKGKSIAHALTPVIPGSEAVMLVGADAAAPEVLLKAFGEMASMLDRQAAAMEKLRKTLLGNAISLGAIVAVMFFIMSMVVPQLTAAMTPELERETVFAPAYFAFGRGFIAYGAYVGVALVALGFFVGWSLPNWTVGWRRFSRTWFDRHLAPWTLYARLQATFFLSSAAAMMRSGIPLKSVATNMVPYASPWMRRHLRKILRDLTVGRTETEVLAGGMLPEDSAGRLQVYSLMPDFTGIMTRLSDDNFVAYERAIDRIGASLKSLTFMLLIIFAGATLFAMFDFSNALQESINKIRNG